MFYSINLELDKFEVVIIGGGEVAYRKCKNFIDFNKKVKVIAPKFIKEFQGLRDKVELIEDIYKEEYIKDSFIVVAATNNKDVNKAIGEYCNLNNKLVNVVDSIELSNYTVPSYIKRGDLLISVSTSGKSPSLSRKIKEDLESQYDDSYEEYINLLGEVRRKIIAQVDDATIRRNLIKNLINLNLKELREEKNKYSK
ncbi:bifunctional precorrin-2 dehydrogenase/sirohydrochlorin ferrochelatase [Romboutsia ilealis]|uniref:precorrin-2 dehydrogenase n=1 Tax=Romboutsia faecis TaxID=2764597 RepID=A0ABR7JTQ8_9FIRM|nr:bifunctional precorrin-2 dehydrogenase/sirohydrochlorin ferrochelatase [Romboutsia faecis]MBC5998293.1 bifunctional precorrin-2 dehydrogenase/sirohydrochlorin ferrochelatase [Romboutsia faecis]MRN25919.1 bifunctional precorrin-2 dehydrogenase/sirohydrochlorin ferrochelatase [Romboutsia ilealis]